MHKKNAMNFKAISVILTIIIVGASCNTTRQTAGKLCTKKKPCLPVAVLPKTLINPVYKPILNPVPVVVKVAYIPEKQEAKAIRSEDSYILLENTLKWEKARGDSLQEIINNYHPIALAKTLDTTRKALKEANKIAKPIKEAIKQGAQIYITMPETNDNILKRYGWMIILGIVLGSAIGLLLTRWFRLQSFN